MTDNNAHARQILASTSYVVLATADADGSPWATPVWFAAEGLDRLFWVSWPGSRHSLLVEQRPQIALTVFDSTVVPNNGAAFYATARAQQCPDDQLDHGLEVLNRRSLAQNLGGFTRERLTAAARLRLYVAEISDAWVLDQDAEVDQRAPVPR
ncbi:pyridoxamine 5'-phosphate oxidase family protein [Luteipulveratus sp. YIM 133132]|uniref:Pyridoxamine 5'-phosphate oxidase family protein n=1 Tax=Luteipulveratus flavus TaxID=3031728 RepID=A0ABT6C1D0_9MICO|nr:MULTISPECIES: pyridoxamine 5'-phosphate oxidase family protein [unclassified Luteipulveratus]MDE9364794.1 pyridoxamine 5'-phosphate oxidase family protein [Luteipulveratus sp. YIM 133132]MDF8262649.1 pyridoxamine 5'-phosphate oxidase family protein [Luteipulveratus sp. YIM 133296]